MAQKKKLQDPAREQLRKLMQQYNVDMATLSKNLGRNHAYIHQYLMRGSPRELSYKMVCQLAIFFNVKIEIFMEVDFSKILYDELSIQEKRFLKKYRKMNSTQREIIKQYLSNMNKDKSQKE